MINIEGKRFVDEGENFRNYTYAQFGKKVLNSRKVKRGKYLTTKLSIFCVMSIISQATFVEASTLEILMEKAHGLDKKTALQTINDYNKACTSNKPFDPHL